MNFSNLAQADQDVIDHLFQAIMYPSPELIRKLAISAINNTVEITDDVSTDMPFEDYSNKQPTSEIIRGHAADVVGEQLTELGYKLIQQVELLHFTYKPRLMIRSTVKFD